MHDPKYIDFLKTISEKTGISVRFNQATVNTTSAIAPPRYLHDDSGTLKIEYVSSKHVVPHKTGGPTVMKGLRKVIFEDIKHDLQYDTETEVLLLDETKLVKKNVFYLDFINGGTDIKLKYAIAYYETGTLHIYWPFLYKMHENGIRIFQWLLMESFKELNKELNTKKKVVDTTSKDISEILSKIHEKSLNESIDQVGVLNSEISYRMSEIAIRERKIREVNKMRNLIKKDGILLNEVREQFKVLKRHTKIRSIKAQENNIYVFTKRLKLQVKTIKGEQIDADFDIGSYEIVIDLFNNTVKVFNELRVDSNDHPHIQNGIPCWGNLSKSIPKLMANNDFVSIVQLVLEYLHSYTDGDTYINIYNFVERIGTKKSRKSSRRKRRDSQSGSGRWSTTIPEPDSDGNSPEVNTSIPW